MIQGIFVTRNIKEWKEIHEFLVLISGHEIIDI